MTDSMNAETSGGRPRQPIRPLTQATAEGPSISQDPLRENTFNAETAGGTMPQPGSRPQREGAGSAAPSSPMPGRGPRFGELGRKAKDFFLGTRKRAAATVGGTVLIGASALVAADQAGAFESNTSVPPTAGATVPGFEPNGTLPPGLTTEPATQVPTEVPATPTETATPVVRGPEHGLASIDKMEGVPVEVQAKLQEILAGKEVDVLGNRSSVSHDPMDDRTTCLEAIQDNPKEIPCKPMSELTLNLSDFPDALQRLDAASPAAVELIRDADGGALPFIKAYVEDTNTIEDISLATQDPNKVIISYHFSAAPDGRGMILPSSTTNFSAEVYKIDDWIIIKDDIYTDNSKGSEANSTQNWKAAGQMNDSIASFANQGFKKANLVHGGPIYATTSAEGQYIAKNFSSKLYDKFQPGRTTTSSGTEINSIIRVK